MRRVRGEHLIPSGAGKHLIPSECNERGIYYPCSGASGQIPRSARDEELLQDEVCGVSVVRGNAVPPYCRTAIPLVLLLATACELGPPRYSPSSLALSAFAGTSLDPGVARARLDGEAATQIIPWADTSKLGDTTFYSRGRVVTTVSIFTDSLWAVRPPVTLGLPSGPFNLPPDSLCTLGYTGTTLPVADSATVLRRLDRIHQCGARVFPVLRQAKMLDPAGKLSVEASKAELDRWPWTGLCARVKDSTIIAFYIGTT